ncbi:MAG: FKBP-type peptidyl-prolyl cis-trans isomerase [Methanomassiliicoccaceae archaeon]|jgi:FKBP-type peptidyl-prolyl cis-trans isomerase 2|nr:FKBP-type peptidyl-prolyl cis-trans isomerase [Methanomassiliicoccaceae archaeon]
MSEDTDVPTKKGRDPILMIGAIVLALAFAVVISGYAYGEFTTEAKEPAKYGSAVKVDYIGSYYGYYDEDGAVVFDTSKWSIASDEGIAKSWEFTERDEKQYVPFSVNIGSGGALRDFENILIGMKPGDTVRIKIPDAYGVVKPAEYRHWDLSTDFNDLSVTETMSIDMYKTMFALDTVYPGPQPDMKHPYGWMSSAFYDSTGIVTVTHHVEDGKDYFDKDENIKFTVTTTSATTFNLAIEFSEDQDGRLIEFRYGGQKYFITEFDGTAFTTKNTDERTGMDLYFVITFVDYS